METLKVIKMEARTSAKVAETKGNEGRFFVVTVETSGKLRGKDAEGNVQVFDVPKKQTGFVAWQDSPIPGRDIPDYGATLKVGQVVPGDIVQRHVKEYFIPSPNGLQENEEGIKGRYANIAKVPVFGNTEDKEDFHMQIVATFKNRGFILPEEGAMGAPGGNLEAAALRVGTRDTSHSIREQLPANMQNATPQEIEEYSAASSQRQQSEASTTR